MTPGMPVQDRRHRGSAGFTMIEVLVAFVVLATLTLAVQRGLAASMSSTTRADERLGADLVARTLISIPLGAGPAALQSQSGSMNGYRWAIQFESVELPVPARNVADGKSRAWRPARMVITVAAPSNAKLKVETIRLVEG